MLLRGFGGLAAIALGQAYIVIRTVLIGHASASPAATVREGSCHPKNIGIIRAAAFVAGPHFVIIKIIRRKIRIGIRSCWRRYESDFKPSLIGNTRIGGRTNIPAPNTEIPGRCLSRRIIAPRNSGLGRAD
ncbi:MAG: hypothetical protein UY23_C0001G0276 [Candidatus Jorgensenbacteria bacterium GW2011_GWA1_48_11]|uniref:Uncharacterized protein n=1 Tax=Candidatus Jorgensenbacteria bacterium GW2011_GWA1_48_11 TaxID=1618660 RepID=A0A0G1XBJ6_9BACT|nr:MAG: hypothetical protein UY23_C0001G0276 [Candidatus Jorgensenbacteria bacterium GW2011_GWA1_48_11]